jgi:GDP-mannose pyrophosphatase NudK
MEEELGCRYVSPAAIMEMEKIVFFTCAYSPADKVSDGGGLKEEGEDIEVVETTLQQAVAMIAAGELIVDATTVVLVQYLINRMQAAACS